MSKTKGPKNPEEKVVLSPEDVVKNDDLVESSINDTASATERMASIISQPGLNNNSSQQTLDYLKALIANQESRAPKLKNEGYSPEEINRMFLEELQSLFKPFPPNPTPGPEAYERYDLLKQQQIRVLDAQRGYALKALQTGVQETLALYLHKDKWKKVSDDPLYASRQLELPIILDNIQTILRTCIHPDAETVNIAELGPGTGTKSNKIRKSLHRLGLDFTHHHYDASPQMLYDTLIKPVLDIARNAENTAKRGKARAGHPFKELVDFIIETEAKTPEYPNNALEKIEILLHRMIAEDVDKDDPEYEKVMKVKNGDFFKFCLARIFSLHLSDHDHAIQTLDEEVNLPYKFVPHHKRYDQIDATDVAANKTTSTIFFHQGNDIANKHPRIGIQKIYRDLLLNDPIVPAGIEDPDERERLTIATYAVIGTQLGKFDTPDVEGEEFEKEGARILEGYDIPNLNDFVSHLFTDEEGKFVKFVDGSGRRIKPENCVEVIAEFKEDPDNPGYYGTVHTLRFTRKVYAVVDRLGSNMNVVEKNKGDEIILLPSYKPTIKQMIQLFEESHIQVVQILTNDLEDPENAVFIVRKMSKKEINDYKKRMSKGSKMTTRDSQEIMIAAGFKRSNKKKKKTASKKIRRRERKGSIEAQLNLFKAGQDNK